MTNSDQLMLAAVCSQVPFQINGREVKIGNDTITVYLLSSRLATLDMRNRTLTVAGGTLVTRKSARVLNALLERFTDFRMRSVSGQWILCGPAGMVLPVGQNDLTVPVLD